MHGSKNPEAAFLALMTASATHEVRNVLAIIKESAGLIQDMVYLFEKKGTLDREKLHRTADRIDTQVRRGADLLTSLNRLSHALDSETTSLDLDEEVRELLSLSQRSARKRGHQLIGETRERPIPLDLNQLHLYMALFHAMRVLLDSLSEGSTLTVRVFETTENAVVEFVGTRDGEMPAVATMPEEELEGVRFWAHALKAEIQELEEGFGLRILFPQTTGP